MMLVSWCMLSLLVFGAEAGWLDRVVLYHKHNFIDDMKNTLLKHDTASNQANQLQDPQALTDDGPETKALSGETAALLPLPPGFQDDPHWDIESVSRLLDTLHGSQSGRRVLRALRRSMAPTRRWMISKQMSYKLFPSIQDDNLYQSSREEFEDPEEELEEEYPMMMSNFTDEAVVVVGNPVEARLPSGHISVRMLKTILEERARAGRIMPSTTIATIKWTTAKKKKKTKLTSPLTSGGNGTDPGSNGTDPGGNGTDLGGNDTDLATTDDPTNTGKDTTTSGTDTKTTVAGQDN